MTADGQVQSDFAAFQAAEKRLEELERRVYGQGWQSLMMLITLFSIFLFYFQ